MKKGVKVYFLKVYIYMPKCVSVCRKKTLSDCGVNSKCVYTKRKYCRLSSKYKMSKPSCNVIKRMSKKQAATHIQKLFIKNRTKKRTLKRMDKSASSVVTPRKAYVNKYFVGKEKPITLLGKRDFFQVSFTNPNQFKKYVQITDKPRIDCFIQTLFSLGLRDRKEGKKDIVKLEKYKIGIKNSDAAKYIQTSFGLKPGQVDFRIFDNVFKNNDEFKKDISDNLQRNIDNNYATIVFLEYEKGKRNWGHYIVAYKYNDKIVYFDPQDKTHTKHTHKLSLEGVIVSRYGYFKIKNVRKSVELQNNICPMEFLGGE